jgi:hypothetical protein
VKRKINSITPTGEGDSGNVTMSIPIKHTSDIMPPPPQNVVSMHDMNAMKTTTTKIPLPLATTSQIITKTEKETKKVTKKAKKTPDPIPVRPPTDNVIPNHNATHLLPENFIKKE